MYVTILHQAPLLGVRAFCSLAGTYPATDARSQSSNHTSTRRPNWPPLPTPGTRGGRRPGCAAPNAPIALESRQTNLAPLAGRAD